MMGGTEANMPNMLGNMMGNMSKPSGEVMGKPDMENPSKDEAMEEKEDISPRGKEEVTEAKEDSCRYPNESASTVANRATSQPTARTQRK